MVFRRHFVQYGIIFNVLYTFVHMEFMIETLPSCGNQQFVEADGGNMPHIQSGLHSDSYNVTPMFNVGFVDKHVVGNISWSLPNGPNGAVIPDVRNIYVRLKLIVNEELEDVKYFAVKHSYHVQENNTEIYEIINFSCIYITSSPNASLKVDMFLLDRKSCDYDIIKENQTRRSNILCHMFPISQNEFPFSKMSCHLYNHYSRININLTPQIGIRARRISENITIFNVYMTDINPFSSVQIWVFPSEDPVSDVARYINYPETPIDDSEDPYDDPDGHHDHIAFWETWTNSAGEVRLIKTEDGRHHSQFFVKVVTFCPQNDHVAFYTDDIDYDDDFASINISESFLSVEEMHHQVPHGDDSLLRLIRTSPEVMYGVVGGLVLTACIIAVLVWIKFHNNKFLSCSMHKENNVLPGREETHKNLLDIESTTSVLNNSQNHRTDGMNTDSMEHVPRTMLVHHANTKSLQSKITDLEIFLTRNGIHVEQYNTNLKENWYDFAERAGSSYRHVIFVLSPDLLTLLDIYRSMEPKGSKLNGSYSENTSKWTELMIDRNWNIVPCVVLNKLRILYNERQTLFRVHLIVFSDENLKESSVSLQSKFLSTFRSFLNFENTISYTFKSSDLTKVPVPNSDCKHLLTQLLLSQNL